MAARGTIAKEKITQIIAKAFGEKYLGEHDKKLYIEAEENGEMVQIAITMTCPKNPIGVVAIPQEKSSNSLNFENDDNVQLQNVVEVSQEEKANIAELMKRLGL